MKLIWIKIAKQPAESVVTGQAVGQGEKAARKRLFGLGKHRHIHRSLTTTEYAAQSYHQKFMKVVQRGIAAARIFKTFPTRPKLLQSLLTGHKNLLQETSGLTALFVSANRDPWRL